MKNSVERRQSLIVVPEVRQNTLPHRRVRTLTVHGRSDPNEFRGNGKLFIYKLQFFGSPL